MKEIKPVVLLGMLGAFAPFSLITAHGKESRFYVNGDLGGTLTGDSEEGVAHGAGMKQTFSLLRYLLLRCKIPGLPRQILPLRLDLRFFQFGK